MLRLMISRANLISVYAVGWVSRASFLIRDVWFFQEIIVLTDGVPRQRALGFSFLKGWDVGLGYWIDVESRKMSV